MLGVSDKNVAGVLGSGQLGNHVKLKKHIRTLSTIMSVLNNL